MQLPPSRICVFRNDNTDTLLFQSTTVCGDRKYLSYLDSKTRLIISLFLRIQRTLRVYTYVLHKNTCHLFDENFDFKSTNIVPYCTRFCVNLNETYFLIIFLLNNDYGKTARVSKLVRISGLQSSLLNPAFNCGVFRICTTPWQKRKYKFSIVREMV